MSRLKLRLPLAFLGIVLGVAFAAAARAVDTVAPVKSPNDPREYALTTLDNGLLALLISDPETDKAAAALDVGVGSSADPSNRLGLAHFLEHMLFLGTTRHPDPDEYQEFIARHGGSHNAYTAFENTNYYFDIDNDHLEGALDRFSQFFVSPLFNADYVERERKAVHSEYVSKLKDDSRRGYAVMQQAANPAHPLSRFAVGSLQTLHIDRPGALRADLVEFYKRHYRAPGMRLVVLGREPIAQLDAWVRAKFSAVAGGKRQPASTPPPMFEPGRLPLRLDIVPEKEARSLTLLFPIPPISAHYRAKPVEYLAGLLGHEGPGSVLAVLKRRGWAQTLAAGLGADNSDGAALTVNIELTRAGATHIDAIVALVFQYIDLIRNGGIESWRHAEQARLYDIAFQFAQRAAAIDYVSNLAGALQLYPSEDVLRAGYRNDEFSPELIARYLEYLNPRNVLLTVLAPETEPTRTERWYGARYSERRLDARTLREWREHPVEPALALPGPNLFIPDSLALTTASPDAAGAAPVRVEGARGVELWHHQDLSYREPRASFYLSVRSAAVNASARNSVLTDMYIDLVREELNEYTYPATVASLRYEIYKHVRGFTVKIAGYADKQPVLLDAILARIVRPELAADRFAIVKESLRRDLENSRKDAPYAQALREVTNSLVHRYFSVEARLAALAPIEPEDLRAFVPTLLHQVYPIALAHGNRTRADALALARRVEAALLAGRTPHDVAPALVAKLSPGDFFGRILAIDHPDAALALYYQGPDKRYSSRAAMELLGQILAAPYYAVLRTDKQLGYVVFSGSTPLLDVPGLVFVVQSPVADPGMLETQTQAFLRDIRAELEYLDDDTLAQHKQGLITRIMDIEQRLQERSERYWNELDLGYTRFDSRERLVEAIERIGRLELLAFFDTVLTGDRTRRLSIRAPGQPAAGALDVDPAFTLLSETGTLEQIRPHYAAGSYPDPAPDRAGQAGVKP